MSNLKKSFLITAILLICFTFLYVPKKEKVLYAFTDLFIDWYSLTLYPDNTFELHFPVTDYTGVYKINGDTIILIYNKKEHNLPEAYCINNTKKIIDELTLINGRYEIKQENNRKIIIVENNLNKYIKTPSFSDIKNDEKTYDSTSEKVVDFVSEQSLVKRKMKLMDSLSEGKRNISILPLLVDSTKNIYQVKVGEDNGINFVTYYNFILDADSMKIISINPS